MPHPIRNDAPGAMHHVWNRGVSRRTVSEHKREARFLISRLALEIRADRIFLLAYAILANHFHLLVESLTGELSSALQSPLSQHTRRFNFPRSRSGALFSGRFRSRRVCSYRDALGLIRYIHWNPVKAGLSTRPETYCHSSAWYLAADHRVPIWLRRGWEARPKLRPVLTPPPDDATWRLLEARSLQSGGRADPLDDLLGASPTHVQAWFHQRALVADQRDRLLPVADALAVLAVCRQAQLEDPLWRGNPSGCRERNVWPLARVALLRELCGMPWREIGQRLDVGATTAKGLHDAHARCLLADSAYRDRVAALASTCLGTVDLQGSGARRHLHNCV